MRYGSVYSGDGAIETAPSQQSRRQRSYFREPTVSRALTLSFSAVPVTMPRTSSAFMMRKSSPSSLISVPECLPEQNAVAFLYREWEHFTSIVGLALPHRDARALLRFIFCGIGDDEASPRSSHLSFAAHQDAVMGWSKFRCHNCQTLFCLCCDRDKGPGTEANKRVVLRFAGTRVCFLKLHCRLWQVGLRIAGRSPFVCSGTTRQVLGVCVGGDLSRSGYQLLGLLDHFCFLRVHSLGDFSPLASVRHVSPL